MIKTIIILFVFGTFFYAKRIVAQTDAVFFTKKQTDILDNLYSYNFFRADSLIKTSKVKKENNWYLTLINYYWWQTISGNDSIYFSRKAIEKADAGILNLKKKKEKFTNNDIYSLIIFYAFKARFEILDNNYLKALRFLQKSIKYISISLKETGNFEGFKLTTGLYFYTIAHIMENFPLFYPYVLFFPKGDKILGIKYLKECALSKDIVLRTEAKYFLMKIYTESENNYPAAEIFAKNLTKQYPRNMVFNYYLYNLLILQNKTQESETLLKIIKKRSRDNLQINEKQKKHFINIIDKNNK